MFASQVFMILFLIFLEGILSMDNALALAAMVRHMPSTERKKALNYGIWGAITFRVIALFFLTEIIQNQWIRLLGAGYLIFLSLEYFCFDTENGEIKKPSQLTFWRTVLMVELTDIAFSADSILATVSISQVYMITLIGGISGIIMMRIAANWFAILMNIFPRLEDTAYYLILLSGLRLLGEAAIGMPIPDWAFQLIFISILGYGFSKKIRTKREHPN